MGQVLRKCAECGAPVRRIGREVCCRCWRRAQDAAARAACPDCGRVFVLDPETGRCVRCSHRCTQCGHTLRFRDSVLCKECRRKARALEAKAPCPRCGRPGLLREATGWCGPCSRPRQPKAPPRECVSRGQPCRPEGYGMCSACYQASPERVFIRAGNLIARLSDPPAWLADFAAHLAAASNPGRASALITQLGRLLTDGGPTHPQALLERCRTPGRSMGALARSLEAFFTARGLALPLDQAQRRAAERRQRRVCETPEPLRALVADFEAAMVGERERARHVGTRPRTDGTIEHHLATARDFARFLVGQRGKHDWALVDAGDIEAFLAARPAMAKSYLSGLRRLMRTAKARRAILIDPTAGLSVREPRAFHGQVLARDRQRELYRRWTQDRDMHPHQAFVGPGALLHGASILELRFLTLDDIDHARHRLHLGKRPTAVPVDPVTWNTLESCLAHRAALKTSNPHVIVTKGTKLNSAPASHYYMTHVLDPAGLTPKTARNTRMTDPAAALDPKIPAAAFGPDPQAALYYTADGTDAIRIQRKPAA
jgi:hypothetical protein